MKLFLKNRVQYEHDPYYREGYRHGFEDAGIVCAIILFVVGIIGVALDMMEVF